MSSVPRSTQRTSAMGLAIVFAPILFHGNEFGQRVLRISAMRSVLVVFSRCPCHGFVTKPFVP